MGLQAKEYRWPLESEENKGTNSPLEPPEELQMGTQMLWCQSLDPTEPAGPMGLPPSYPKLNLLTVPLALFVCVLLTAWLSIQPEVWLLPLATHAWSVTWSHQHTFCTVIHHTAEAWVMSTSSCHPNHSRYPPILPLTDPSQFLLLDIPWVPVFLRLPAAFKINFKFLSQTSNIHCQLISKHPIAVQAWITFVLEIALKMQALCLLSCCSCPVHISLEECFPFRGNT